MLEGLTSLSFGALGAAAQFIITSLDGVVKDGSTVKQLESNTQKLVNEGHKDPFIAARVIFAERERVVINEQFASDPPPIVFHGKNHREVCKPTPNWTKPLDVITDLL